MTSSELLTVRKLYSSASKKEEDLNKLVSLTSKADKFDNPVLYGYAAAAEFMKAQYLFLPTSKLKSVDTGRDMLEAVIKVHPNNCELRFIRLSIQKELPFFIDYKSNIEEDQLYLNTYCSELSDLELQKLINYYL